MTCASSGIWFYGLHTTPTGPYYGVSVSIRTPKVLKPTDCTVAYWVACRSTTLDEHGACRFYQSTIAYTPNVGRWHFSFGYSTEHLAQPPYTGLTPEEDHAYALGVKFDGINATCYVTDLETATDYAMGTVPDSGSGWTGDKPGLVMEGFSDDPADTRVDQFEAYGFELLAPAKMSFLDMLLALLLALLGRRKNRLAWREWDGATSFVQGAVPLAVRTSDLGSHHYLVGIGDQGVQMASESALW